VILVVGVTGVVGGMIARQLLKKDKEVRVLMRCDSPSSQLVQRGLATSAEELIEAGAQPVHGELRDRASLDAAVEGVKTVITTANSAMRGGADNPQSVDLEGNRNLIEAARDASVEHFIFVSLLGADPHNPVPFVRAKAQSEAALRESGVGYTILAPTAFMEVWPAMVVGMPALQGQPVTLVGEGRRRHSFVSNRDVAAFAVSAVDRPEARNQYLAIGGPEHSAGARWWRPTSACSGAPFQSSSWRWGNPFLAYPTRCLLCWQGWKHTTRTSRWRRSPVPSMFRLQD
jgi:uncharacterized protein YbjT (DUF2867 family)